jgi:transcriptional regulator GlxA family with amidase domain
MQASIIAFDDFTDIDVFFLWDLLNRVREPGLTVRLLGSAEQHVSSTGLRIPMHGRVSEAAESDVVLVASGLGVRRLVKDDDFLSSLRLDPGRQLVGSMCSGALILAVLGLLEGKEATTYPTAKGALESYGVRVVERPFVRQGNVATAAGCLEDVLRSVQPVGEGLSFDDVEVLNKVYSRQVSS